MARKRNGNLDESIGPIRVDSALREQVAEEARRTERSEGAIVRVALREYFHIRRPRGK